MSERERSWLVIFNIIVAAVILWLPKIRSGSTRSNVSVSVSSHRRAVSCVAVRSVNEQTGLKLTMHNDYINVCISEYEFAVVFPNLNVSHCSRRKGVGGIVRNDELTDHSHYNSLISLSQYSSVLYAFTMYVRSLAIDRTGDGVKEIGKISK